MRSAWRSAAVTTLHPAKVSRWSMGDQSKSGTAKTRDASSASTLQFRWFPMFHPVIKQWYFWERYNPPSLWWLITVNPYGNGGIALGCGNPITTYVNNFWKTLNHRNPKNFPHPLNQVFQKCYLFLEGWPILCPLRRTWLSNCWRHQLAQSFHHSRLLLGLDGSWPLGSTHAFRSKRHDGFATLAHDEAVQLALEHSCNVLPWAPKSYRMVSDEMEFDATNLPYNYL